MKSVKDVFTMSSGVFGAIKALSPGDYAYLFGEIESSDLDLEVLAKCGNRICAPIVSLSGDDVPTVARLILNRYLANWRRIKDSLSIQYDVLRPAVSGYTITKTGNTTKEDASNRGEENKVYGFDSDTGANDSSRTVTNSGTTNVDTLSTTTYNKTGVGSLTPNRLIEAEISFRRLSFLNICINDVKEFITLSIYN